MFAPLHASILPRFSPASMAAVTLIAEDPSERWDAMVVAGSIHRLPSGGRGLSGVVR